MQSLQKSVAKKQGDQQALQKTLREDERKIAEIASKKREVTLSINNLTGRANALSGDQTRLKQSVEQGVEKAKMMKNKAKTNEEKIKATAADEKAKERKREVAAIKFKQAHLWDKVPTKDQVAKKIQNWNAKITKMEMDLKHKDDNKEVSLGTSKINYMDPRITVAWCKRNDVPIEKVFSKTLRDKFNWAMAVVPDWEFNAKIANE